VIALSAFSFECQHCGVCCLGHPSGIPIYIIDLCRLSSYLHISTEEFLSKFCSLTNIGSPQKPVPVLSLQLRNGKCPFLYQKTCSVHQYKPYLCKAAPIISVLFENSSLMDACRKKCPGFGKGNMISENEMQKILETEYEIEIADKKAYQRGWYTKIKKILNKEVSK
jgi:uncharacterized protein